MSDLTDNKNQSIDVELSEEVAEGKYSNLAIINHSPGEFVLDFLSLMPGMPKAKVKSRIVLSPEHAKRLLSALSDNVRRYEATYGEIREGGVPSGMPINFGPTGEA